ncbi:uncharacterized protein LOC131684175 [Topomyia yanbarensis]|uniref:uncharacterized protein LOC131684175 n=1 Tax=Topomyia yanbarensis TaxID=2498891 RepID=UPI00273ADB9D|nr:uncharacterized protein LOC131684175 [Topomyia yanbarensis]
MDQYPYSIPSSFPPYSEDVANKNDNESQLQTHNPYYINTSSTETVFGFIPADPQQQQQQTLLPQPAVQPNGLISSLQTDAHPVNYELYPDQHYTHQMQSVPVIPPPISMEATVPEAAPTMGLENAYNQQDYIREAIAGDSSISYPLVPISEVPPPPSATQIHPDQSLDSEPFVVGGATLSVPGGTSDGLDIEAVAVGETISAPVAIETEQVKPPEQSFEAESTDVQWESQSITASELSAANPPETPEPSMTISADEQCASGDHTDQPTAITENAAPQAEEPIAEVSQIDPAMLDANSLTLEETTQVAEGTITEPQSEITPSSPTTASKPDETPVDQGALCTKKKRRRIVQMNDDDDSDEEDGCDRLELLRSPEPPAIEDEPVNTLDPSVVNEKTNEDGNGEGASDKEEEDRPDSAASDGMSAAKTLFQNVVMIPAGDAEAHKRKKIRVLESDDEEDEQQNNVDDIGLTGEGAEDEVNPAGFLMDENAECGDYSAMEGIEMDKMEQIVTMDAPIIDPSRMINEDDDDDEAGSEGTEKDREGSDREQDADEQSDVGSQEEEELGEEEEIVEEGVEMITAEDDAGEAIGIATDDENELDDAEADEDDDRGSDQEEQASARSDAESEHEHQSASSKEDGENQSETRSAASPVDQEKKKERNDVDETKSGSEDEVICQNDLELNTISLLTDEEDDNMPPLPPPKKELPVVRIVNIKKELLDTRIIKREGQPKHHSSSTYLKQHHQQSQKKHEKKHKKRERVFDNNDPFGAWSSSTSDDEFIPNDIYFGTPDRVFTANTKIRCQRQKDMNERYTKYGGKTSKRRFSDDSDAEERRKRKQKLEQISRLNLPAYQQAQLQNLVKKKNKRKQDRFYDKSQEIPNDIYFGNVNVPLHVLYAFGSSSSDDERVDRNRPSTSWRPPPTASSKHSKYQPTSRPYKSTSSSSYSKSTVSPSNDRSVQAMKEYLKIAGFKNVKFHKLWEGCKSNQERANAILRLMQEKGLEGEPTIAKCRELRKQLQMEREAKVLDTSLIIASGEGRITRRSARNPQNQGLADPSDPNAPSTSGVSHTVPPEGLETLNRIRNVIDPDSDGE